MKEVNDLQLVKRDDFGGIECDFYRIGEEIWMTRAQIGAALGYSNPNTAIGIIHLRHKERLDKFSRVFQIEVSLGEKQEVVLYSAKGVYEICRWSRKPKADAFFDWVYDVLESIRKTGYYKLPSKVNIPELVENIYGKKEAKRIQELNETSDQVKIGFAFHNENYMTVKEIVEAYKGIDERNVWAELRLGGYIEPVFCKKGQYGVPYQCYIERLSEKGKEFGQEIWNRRKKSTQPFSFRWRKDKVPEIIKIYLPILERR